jgi:hypothetical protein
MRTSTLGSPQTQQMEIYLFHISKVVRIKNYIYTAFHISPKIVQYKLRLHIYTINFAQEIVMILLHWNTSLNLNVTFDLTRRM